MFFQNPRITLCLNLSVFRGSIADFPIDFSVWFWVNWIHIVCKNSSPIRMGWLYRLDQRHFIRINVNLFLCTLFVCNYSCYEYERYASKCLERAILYWLMDGKFLELSLGGRKKCTECWALRCWCSEHVCVFYS